MVPQSTVTESGRNVVLDVLRAAAISMVVCYHVINLSPHQFPLLMSIGAWGAFGVDLFFVLSGWLIGGLYWRECARFGDVDILHFWKRRWLRTLPPYYVALLFSWIPVYLAGREPFDFGYLIFIQNYYRSMPYFVISWSLCIEEHLYLLLPLILVKRIRSHLAGKVFYVFLIVLAPVCRWVVSSGPDGINAPFGFLQVATHMRLEALLIGFGLSALSLNHPAAWVWARRAAPWLLVSGIAATALSALAGHLWLYRIGWSGVGVIWASLLVVLVERPIKVPGSRTWIRGIAISSYSIYLTHAMMIHVARAITDLLPRSSWFLYYPIALLLIAIAGTACYLGVERTSIVVRDRWAPRRRVLRHAA
jgi:peptidoglycan/LPS O-acetylase OafA/YrhL